MKLADYTAQRRRQTAEHDQSIVRAFEAAGHTITELEVHEAAAIANAVGLRSLQNKPFSYCTMKPLMRRLGWRPRDRRAIQREHVERLGSLGIDARKASPSVIADALNAAGVLTVTGQRYTHQAARHLRSLARTVIKARVH